MSKRGNTHLHISLCDDAQMFLLHFFKYLVLLAVLFLVVLGVFHRRKLKLEALRRFVLKGSLIIFFSEAENA